MKIYTKTGDSGETSLLGGSRVPKYHLRIETYGTVDELNAYIGMLRDYNPLPETNKHLLFIQDRLFTIGSMLASEEKDKNIHIPIIYEQDSEYLEREMDRMDATLPPMRSFVLPGGHPAVSFCHISRCVCRRAERHAVRLSSLEEVPSVVIVFLNRLSDYLFLLSREWSHVLNIQETPWKPQKNKN